MTCSATSAPSFQELVERSFSFLEEERAKKSAAIEAYKETKRSPEPIPLQRDLSYWEKLDGILRPFDDHTRQDLTAEDSFWYSFLGDYQNQVVSNILDLSKVGLDAAVIETKPMWGEKGRARLFARFNKNLNDFAIANPHLELSEAKAKAATAQAIAEKERNVYDALINMRQAWSDTQKKVRNSDIRKLVIPGSAASLESVEASKRNRFSWLSLSRLASRLATYA